MIEERVCPKCGSEVPWGATECPHCGHEVGPADGPDDDSLVGTMVGEYRITGILREGGMGLVYEAHHPVIGKKAVVKVLRGEMAGDEESVTRFLWEARAVNTIGHPNIVDIFSFGRLEDGSPYMIMEKLEGETLHQYLESHGVMDYAMARKVLGQIMDALEAAHDQGIVHRDLKPDNVFLVDRPGGVWVKLLDFGIAKFMDRRPMGIRTRTGMPMGTPHFMSPEQCAGRRDVDSRSDIYSLGVMMYRMFAGVFPFHSESYVAVMNAHLFKNPPPPSLVSDVPADLEKIILWCMEKKPADRPQTVRELRERLISVLDSLADGNRTPTVYERARSMTEVAPEEFEELRSQVSLGWLKYTVAGTFLFFVAVLGALVWRSMNSGAAVRIPAGDDVTSPPDSGHPVTADRTHGDSGAGFRRSGDVPASGTLVTSENHAMPVMKKVNEINRIQLDIFPGGLRPEITVEGSAHMEGSVLVLTGHEPVRLRIRAAGYAPWTGMVDGSSEKIRIRLMPAVMARSPMHTGKRSAGHVVPGKKKSSGRRGVMKPAGNGKSATPAMKPVSAAPMVDDFL